MSVTLALDLGSFMGYAIHRADGRVESGTEPFTPGAGEGPGIRFVRFRRWLVDVKAANEQLSRIVFEDVKRHPPGQVYAAHVYGGFLAVTTMFAEHHALRYEGYGVGVIKKAWTGNGAAKKGEMIARARDLGFKPCDDNEADAIALLHVALGRCPATPPRPPKPKAPRKRDTATRDLIAGSSDPF